MIRYNPPSTLTPANPPSTPLTPHPPPPLTPPSTPQPFSAEEVAHFGELRDTTAPSTPGTPSTPTPSLFEFGTPNPVSLRRRRRRAGGRRQLLRPLTPLAVNNSSRRLLIADDDDDDTPINEDAMGAWLRRGKRCEPDTPTDDLLAPVKRLSMRSPAANAPAALPGSVVKKQATPSNHALQRFNSEVIIYYTTTTVVGSIVV